MLEVEAGVWMDTPGVRVRRLGWWQTFNTY